MINKKFEAYKISREIKRSGYNFTFKRKAKNDFNEPSKEAIIVGNLLGIYHEQNSNIAISTGDTTQYRTKKIPMILCLYSDVSKLKLNVDDFVIFNSKTFKVTGITNVQEWSIVSDISLEVFDDGSI